MANNTQYRFSRGKDGYVVFDSKGYIIEAKGFGSLMWSTSLNIDNDLVGKHVDELAEMLKKYVHSQLHIRTSFENKRHFKHIYFVIK